jgi:filamentous hemagglutinin family protein
MTTQIERLILIISLTLLSSVQAQIITDGTVGPANTLTGPNYNIGHDLGSQRGNNLFHSFNQFNVNTGETAQFTGPANINNVFSRVTGGSQSFIDGQISSTMPQADLYLINPSGIMFGENATLDVPASFYASTADQIILKDGTTFDATTQGTTPILSAEPFESFGFLDSTQAPVSVNGSTLQVLEGSTLGLIGGDVNISNEAELLSGGKIQINTRNHAINRNFMVNNSQIQASSELANSQIEIDATEMSLTDNSLISLRGNSETDSIRINLDTLLIENSSIITRSNSSFPTTAGSEIRNIGDISIEANKQVTISGKHSKYDTIELKTGGSATGGRLRIQTPFLEIKNQAIINGQTSGTGEGGLFRILADEIVISNSEINVNTTSMGKGGKLSIKTDKLKVENVNFNANTSGKGNGGDIEITAKSFGEDSEVISEVILKESEIAVSSAPETSGNAGLLKFDVDRLELQGSRLEGSTLSLGTGAEIKIDAKNDVIISDESRIRAATYGSGDANRIEIDTSNLEVTKNSSIVGDTNNTGNGADIKITASDIKLSDNSTITTSTTSSGAGGTLEIITNDLNVSNSSIEAYTKDIGTGGTILIDAKNQIELKGRGPIDKQLAYATTIAVDSRYQGTNSGEAGAVRIITPKLSLSEGALISGLTLGSGEGGKLRIIANDSLVVNESNIVATTLGSGKGGTIDIFANNNITLSKQSNLKSQDSRNRLSSTIDATTYNSGQAGDLTIGPITPEKLPKLDISEGASISSATLSEGKGGNVGINVEQVTLDTGSFISAKAEGTGNAGTITINASNAISNSNNSEISTEALKSSSGDIILYTPNLIITDNGSVKADVQTGKKGGNITLEVNTLALTEGGQVSSNSWESGRGGDILITAKDSVNIVGSGISSTTKQGVAGNITLSTQQLDLQQGGRIDSSASSDSGESGSVTVKAKTLNLHDHSIIAAKSVGGPAGRVTLNANKLLHLNGNSEITTESLYGQGGSIRIKTPELVVEDGEINAEVITGNKNIVTKPANIDINVDKLTLKKGLIKSSSEGSGSAGSITINASQYIELSNSQILSTASGTGDAGTIIITGGQYDDGTTKLVPKLALSKESKISTTASGPSNSGSIQLFVDHLQITEGEIRSVSQTGLSDAKPAEITLDVRGLTLGEAALLPQEKPKKGRIETSSTGKSPAGRITITATEYVKIFGNESGLFSTSGDENQEDNSQATGHAGSILIQGSQTGQPVPTLLLNGGEISTTAYGTGDSGHIDIQANNLSVTQGTISSESKIGRRDAQPGNITLAVDSLTLQQAGKIGGRIESSTEGESPAGNITITAKGYISIAGDNQIKKQDEQSGIFSTSGTTENTKATGNAGSITLQGSKTRQPVPTLLLNGGEISTTAYGMADSGHIDIQANNLSVTQGTISSVSKIGRRDAQPGNITLAVDMLTLQQAGETGGSIESSTKGKSPAGNITITATDYIKVFGEDSGIFSTSGGEKDKDNSKATGHAGSISIGSQTGRVPTLSLDKGGKISTTAFGSANSGNIELWLDELQITDGAITSISKLGRQEQDERNPIVPADITIDTVRLKLGDNLTERKGSIESSTEGFNPAGTITITATEYIQVFGNESGIFSTTGKEKPNATGPAGSIRIGRKTGRVPTLSLEQGGEISTTAFGPANSGSIELWVDDLQVTEGEITSVSELEVGSQDKASSPFLPADIRIDVNRLTLGDKSGNKVGRIESSTKGQRPAGQITITASQFVRIFGNKNPDDNSGIFSKSEGEDITDSTGKIEKKAGEAGQIIIAKTEPKIEQDSESAERLPILEINGNAQISTTANSGKSGTIKLWVDELQVTEGEIISISELGRQGAEAANITIDVDKLTLGDKDSEDKVGRIESSTEGQSPAGNITITASQYVNIFGDKTKGPEADNSGIFSKSEGEDSTGNKAGAAGRIIIAKTLTQEPKSEPLPAERVPKMQLKNGATISTTAHSGESGTIKLGVDELQVTKGAITSISEQGRASHDEYKPVPADITIDTLRLTLGEESGDKIGRIESSSEGQNPAGNITITASESVNIFGHKTKGPEADNSGIFSKSEGKDSTGKEAGAAGRIIIAKTLNPDSEPSERLEKMHLTNGAEISTTANSGESGTINLWVKDLQVTEGAITSVSQQGRQGAQAANIKINVGKLTLGDLGEGSNEVKLGRIESSTEGYSPAGNITITATEYVGIFGNNKKGPKEEDNKADKKAFEEKNSGIFSTASGQGRAGKIDIVLASKYEDGRGVVVKGEKIIDSTYIPNEKASLTFEITGGKITTSTNGQGDGGSINIVTSDFQLNKAIISSEVTKESTAKNAGNIIIGTRLLQMSDSEISTDSTDAEGGNILLGVGEILGRRIRNSKISATVKGGDGKGGNLEILGQPKSLILDNTDIIAKAKEGKGGSIKVNANVFIASSDSDISVSSERGIDGEMDIDSAQVNVDSISLLPSNPADVSNMIKDCVAFESEAQWSIVVGGYGKMTTQPGRMGCFK